MLVQTTVKMCMGTNCVQKPFLDHITRFLDVIAGCALLLIGVLAIQGVIPCSTHTAWAILGAGCCYVGIMLWDLIYQVKQHSRLKDKHPC